MYKLCEALVVSRGCRCSSFFIFLCARYPGSDWVTAGVHQPPELNQIQAWNLSHFSSSRGEFAASREMRNRKSSILSQPEAWSVFQCDEVESACGASVRAGSSGADTCTARQAYGAFASSSPDVPTAFSGFSQVLSAP